jgi:activating signal cointegrator complex subunit 3
LTTALRAFGGISELPQVEPAASLAVKRRRKLEGNDRDREWSDLVDVFRRECDHVVFKQADKLLKDLCQQAADIIGESVSPKITQSSAVFLFRLLHHTQHLTKDQSLKIKQTFGPFPAAKVSQAHSTIQHLHRLLPDPDSSLHDVIHQAEHKNNEFGVKIKFSFESMDKDLLIGDQGKEVEEEIGFRDTLTPDAVSMAIKMSMEGQGNDKVKEEEKSKSTNTDGMWLRRCCEKHFRDVGKNGLTVTDMHSALFKVLSSGRGNDAIQNELFDLVGFDNFDLIQELLARREEIVASTVNLSPYDHDPPQLLTKPLQKSPHIASQVTVQSEDERLLKKQIRKGGKREEERHRKMAKRAQKHDTYLDQHEHLKSVGYDPERMRYEREAALLEASNAPLFSSKTKVQPHPAEIYPHVYDAQLKARQASAFIAGVKLLLPEDAKRENTRVHEEVYIPPTSPLLMSESEKLVKISELDDLLQLVFRGMKTLNRIQSIVYPTVYQTNENLLVSAPTGAGKTNIAMLAVMRELKQHIQNGVLKKDEFKIVYVAPMKALAAEMVRTFGQRLAPLGMAVRELTGDMQLTKGEIQKTQMLVTTPEKWDVVTRKGTGDVALTLAVKLLIIDEVHLLHEDRGSVIESLVARTLRQIESLQSMIRIIGLSATLPNYTDVARFLNVNPHVGLFYFDGRFRPVPLGQTFIGLKAPGILQRLEDMDRICYEKVVDQVKEGNQVMVFVHARNGTVKTAESLKELALNEGDISLFSPEQSAELGSAEKQVSRSRNKQLKQLFQYGFSIHHAGMLRADRNLVESLFSRGLIKVLVCTATLAWGVNLPAHAVIIKGTQLYNAEKGAFVDLGILDVLQIFGRAGRPQFDKHGEGMIITTHDKLSQYLSLLTRQQPIESQFVNNLTDNLNAEIALGSVSDIDEAVKWLTYTYLYVRMRLNPLAYGISYDMKQKDPFLEKHRFELIVSTARKLDKARMVRFNERTQSLSSTDLGRTASHFYIKYPSIEVFNEKYKAQMTEADVLAMIAQSTEFEQIKVREEEVNELTELMNESCVMPVQGGVENTYGKVNILLQSYVSCATIDTFSLVSDTAYVSQNAARIIRALFEIAVHRGWPTMAERLLTLCKTVDRRLWAFRNPLWQFSSLSLEIMRKLEAGKLTVDRLRDMPAEEIGHMVRHVRMGSQLKQCVNQFPALSLAANIKPITRTVLMVRLTIEPEFEWNDHIHGGSSEPWWIWVEDVENDHLYHSEYFLLLKKHVLTKEPQTLVFTIPIFEPLPSQYLIHAMSDRWLGAETVIALSFQHLILPERHPPHTDLLNLQPLPITALKDKDLESLYQFSHFNPVQTQVFHTLYHTDSNVLLGSPTGSGKTVAAELAIFRIFREYPGAKAVYIAPLKALVRERIEDWKKRIQEKLGKKVIELTGDVTPDMRAIASSDLIVTTPEKWDGVSRSWQNRAYVQAVALLVIDEIHLLGEERGPVLEVIVSRSNFISSHTEKKVRVVGLSTALANARDLADWLGIKRVGLFNFRPSVRPVPLEVHIQGFPGKHYCPRMASMNKPTFSAIQTHSPMKPTLVFVSSRRQTRLTALDLIAYLAASSDPKQWLHIEETELDSLLSTVKDNNLKLSLEFGIGLHHAGLHERDRNIAEELFVNQKIQVLIATSTLAWGVNFPAHLVVIKGTEYYDGKTHRYVDFPITDVLQMMGRAGRPQFDDKGTAMVFVHDVKKQFYKKFLYEPFPVESSLLAVLPDHLNAEIVAGTIGSKQDCMDYITWTYFFRRLVMNPSYYSLEGTSHEIVNQYLSDLVERAVVELERSHCIEIDEDDCGLSATTLGRIASYYYLHHKTVKTFDDFLHRDCTADNLLQLLSVCLSIIISVMEFVCLFSKLFLL